MENIKDRLEEGEDVPKAEIINLAAVEVSV